MSNREIVYRNGPIQALWWKFMPGQEIVIPWPKLKWIVVSGTETNGVSILTNDPNDHYRPWLEKNVGKQKWDWDWMYFVSIPDDGSIHSDLLRIKFRKKHSKWLSMALLKWKIS